MCSYNRFDTSTAKLVAVCLWMLSDDLTRNDQLDAPILLPAGCRIVGCHWLALAVSMGSDRRAHNSLADQKIANRVRSIFGQLEIEVIGSHAVAMTFHFEGEAGIGHMSDEASESSNRAGPDQSTVLSLS